MLKETRKTDPTLAELVDEELHRQEQNIEMIASESTVPVPVMELSGSVFTNKTLEGYPGARYQAGSHVADKVERLAIERAKELFQAEHVNIQTYSGTSANYSVFAAVLKPGDKILSMRLDQGGHLTHGSPANWMSGFYEHRFYGFNPETEQIDYGELERMAMEENPKLIIAGGSSYPRLIDYERIAGIAKGVGAYFMVDMAHIAGLVAAGVIPSPIPHADFVSSSTTKTFCSARSGMVFSKKEHAKLLDRGTFPGSLGSIHLHTMAAKAWSFKYAATDEFKEIMEQVVINARTLSRELGRQGFRVVSGGTDNHLLVVDLRGKGITGKVFQGALDGIGITVNKNLIPFDPEKPSITSGVRIGLTSVTQRGLKEEEIIGIAEIMNRVADNPKDENVLKECKEDAQKLIARFPLYPEGTFMD
ncbi:serine hydroxymethyltransferase [Gudongella sp. SC589]|uniref:serine hydroxymethyltransferase n=1 Tax=Gudongella sp. SC589 TaxID=3385990 RepID=UPI0039047000